MRFRKLNAEKYIIGSHREPESISISVFDGTGLSAQDILDAAYFLSSEFPVVINFTSSENSPGSITAMSRRDVANSPVDAVILELVAGEFRLNEEFVSEQELRSRMETLAESGRLTESVPFLLLATHDNSSGAQLTNLLQILCDSRISHIVPVFTTEAANKPAMDKPDPVVSWIDSRSSNPYSALVRPLSGIGSPCLDVRLK